MLKPWLRFFRVVNLPTVPGDVLVGAAAVAAGASTCGAAFSLPGAAVSAAALSSVFLYMFGLADNDIVGAKTDVNRPIPSGEISLGAARLARALCLVLAFAPLATGAASWPTLAAAATVAGASIAYNRTKSCFLMGLCRGMNVLLGAVASCAGVGDGAVASAPFQVWFVAVAAAAVWTAYIAAVTRYSEGEERNESLKFRVGILIGAIVYLQLLALVVFALFCPAVKPLLVAGAVLLLALRLAKTAFPSVGAS